MGHVDTECELEQLAREVRRRTSPRRRVAQFAWACLCQCNELCDAACRDRRMHREHVGRGTHQAHRLEVPLEVRVDHEVPACGQQRVAVRPRPRGGADAEIAAGASHVFHVELLSQNFGKLLRKQTRGRVIRPAGGDRNDHPHGPAWIGLRPTPSRGGWRGERGAREGEDATAA
jgi:hypothetical protein